MAWFQLPPLPCPPPFFFCFFLLCFVLVAYGQQQQPPTPKVFWFNQTVDHFNSETQPQNYLERYLVWDGAWQSDGPIFFYTGNEGDIFEFYNNTGFIFEIAPQFGALVVFAEHRYYGESLPYGTNSWSRSNIGLLTIEQALADFADLINYIKATIPGTANSPVISFGGSYGGMLSAWFRIKYPNIIDGALAASAPIPVASEVNPNPTYFQTVTNDYATANPACPDTVRKAFSQVIEMANQGSQALATLSEKFSLCTPFSSPEDVDYWILWAINSFGTLAMMDYPYETDFLAPLPGWPVNTSCEVLLQYEQKGDLLKGLAQAAGIFYNGTSGSMPCFNISQEFVFCADQTGCGTGPSGASWDYQACTEIIYFPNTNNVTDMFPPRNWTKQDLTNYCQQTWGVTPRFDWVSTYFGGVDISSSSNIIFSNGLLDPWHGGGFLESLSDTLVAIIIPEGAHHLDLRFSNPDDPQTVINARTQEIKYITQFINQAQLKNRKNKY